MKKGWRSVSGVVGLLLLISRIAAADSAADALDQQVNDWLEANHASSVAVGVIQDGELVFAKGYGLANREKQEAATADTVYLLASVSKPVVALAALTLVEQGKLDLDEDINQYVGFSIRNPNFPDRPITMRHLLHHAAGLEDASEEDERDYPSDPDETLEQTIRAALLPDGQDYADGAYWSKENAPGEEFEYANIGSALAGLVVEKASGMPFHEYCNAQVFTPLRMNHTRWLNRELPEGTRIAMPYDADFNSYGIYSFNEYPSGSLHSSVNEFARLILMLLHEGELDGVRVLRPESVQEFERPQFQGEDDGEMIGLYIFLSGSAEHGHDGIEAGVSTEFRYNDEGDGAIVLCNADDADTGALIEILMAFPETE